MARLAFLAGLRDPNSGVYRAAMPCKGGEAEVDGLLRSLHKGAFANWLTYRLEEQEADLNLYFSNLDCSKAAAVATWQCLESYRLLVPASATSAERLHFFGDLEALLAVMANEICDLARNASRHSSDSPILTVEDLSKCLGVSPRTLRLKAEVGKIPSVKVGRQWHLTAREIREWLGGRQVDTEMLVQIPTLEFLGLGEDDVEPDASGRGPAATTHSACCELVCSGAGHLLTGLPDFPLKVAALV